MFTRGCEWLDYGGLEIMGEFDVFLTCRICGAKMVPSSSQDVRGTEGTEHGYHDV